ITPERVSELHTTPLIKHGGTSSLQAVQIKSKSPEYAYAQKKSFSIPFFTNKRHFPKHALFIILFFLGIATSFAGYNKYMGSLIQTPQQAQSPLSTGQVLAESTNQLRTSLNFNIATFFNKEATFSASLNVNGLSLFTDDMTVQDAN